MCDFSDTFEPGRKWGGFFPATPKPNILGPELLLRTLDTLRASVDSKMSVAQFDVF